MAGVREATGSGKGKVFAIVGASLAVALCAWVVWSTSFTSNPTSGEMYMDTGTQPPTPYRQSMKIGMPSPVTAPSGKPGYPGEQCFWNKDGSTKTDPTYVLLNAYIGKPGPTFCPDCGRLVVQHNPSPGPGMKPPPTESEYASRGGRSSGASRDER